MSSNTIILITGANTGLGLETVKSLYHSQSSYTILLSSRNIEKANTAAKTVQSEYPSSRSVIKTVQIDVEDDRSISRAFDHVSSGYGHIDVLINNAGSQFDNVDGMSTREKWAKSWDVNVTGTYILTHTFIPLLLKSSAPRLLFITSGVSTLTDAGNTSTLVDASPAAGWPKQGFNFTAYRSSKTGLNMVMREFRRILKNDGVKVWCVSPGFLATGLGLGKEMNEKMGGLKPSVGADFVRDVVEGKRDENEGLVVRKDEVQSF